MGIVNKAISTKFLKIIIRTNHGQTEIVMQYGGLRSSVTCVTTSCSKDGFACATHSVSGGFWRPRKITDVILVQKVLTSMSHVTSCIVRLKYVIKVSLLQKVQNDRIKNIVSVFYGIQCSLNNFELCATIMTSSSPYHNNSASKTIGLVHTLVRKTFPTPPVAGSVIRPTCLSKTNL
jgi:hypothetical protein